MPILAGILPIYSDRHAAFLHNEVPGIDIPNDIQARISSAGEDAPREGINIALELIDQISDWGRGVYLMPPFHKYDIAAEIVEGIRRQ